MKHKIKKLFIAFITLIIGSVFYVSNISHAASREIDFTAYLINSSNKEITNGEYDIRFAIYTADRTVLDAYPSDADATTSLVWEETQKILVKDGVINAYLGAVNPLPNNLTFNNGTYYLGVRMGTDSEMIPRKKIGAVPIAVNANYLAGATVGTGEGNIMVLGPGGKIDARFLPTIGASNLTTRSSSAGITISSGGNSLTFARNALINQNLSTASSPTFKGLTITGLNGVLKTINGKIFGGANTSDIPEGTNLYWTQARFDEAIKNHPIKSNTVFIGGGGGGGGSIINSTSDVPEGSRLYWTDARFDTRFGLSMGSLSSVLDLTQVGNNLGVGTSSPLASLDVYGDVILSGDSRYLNFGLATTSAGYGFRDNGGTMQYKNAGGIWTDISSSASSTASSTSLWAQNGSDIYFNAGNVGIGTSTSPLEKLFVDGNIMMTGNLLPATNNSNVGSIATRIKNGYFENLDVLNMSIASTSISGSASSVFTINSANNTADTEDSTLAFYRGTVSPSAMLTWDSTAKRFDLNFPLYTESNDILTLGRVGIGTTTFASGQQSVKLEVAGAVGANYYCDANGNNCVNVSNGWGTEGRFMGTTTVVTNGSFATSTLIGYQAANQHCMDKFSGSHFCRTDEIIYTIQSGSISNFTGTSWIAEGPPGYTANSNDCNGWTTATSTALGAFWLFDTNGGGAGWLVNCSVSKPISCCK